MDLSKITNQEVRQAIEALQGGDQSWYGFFTEHPEMTDDGESVDFRSFFEMALGNEKFTSINRVVGDGMQVIGSYRAGKLGVFSVFFKFRQNIERKFDRLDIGQA